MQPAPSKPAPPHKSIRARLTAHIRRSLLAGVLALIPLVATFLVLRLLFTFLDDLVQPLVEEIWGRRIIGVGIGITIVSVYVIGVLVSNVFGRYIKSQLDGFVGRIPMLRWLYGMFRQITDAFSKVGGTKFRVVLVEWPSKGLYTIGFHTGSVTDGRGKTYHNILVPTAPTPQTGFLAVFPEEDVIATDISLEDGIAMVVSTGVVAPPDLMAALHRHRREPAIAVVPPPPPPAPPAP
ncbi:MAG: DUF502 domain-containing protein [Dehalococcoidia bacterium]|nr:DUF502 domain-containing protein [Dehalococcoidia bacterium]